ncbi:hypothetical protein Ga0080559_TMP3133 [Salipiger profundus]|uniref:Uncharacterized protein n=1 Tax=Salipiger profundus TaxID=1229727 RepID=A0A1U7D716_9RHOB|nr:hypothetical protein Ga0080559_TMP3133 [Salipiger profundus]
MDFEKTAHLDAVRDAAHTVSGPRQKSGNQLADLVVVIDD